MTKEEFLERLKEDKFFENPQELVDYRLPVVQFYIKNYVNAQVMTERGILQLCSLVIPPINADNTADFTSLNMAYISIINNYKKGGIV